MASQNLIIVLVAALFARFGSACPLVVEGDELPGLVGTKSIGVFAERNGTIVEVPFQIDPRNERGYFTFGADLSAFSSRRDRMTVSSDDAGRQLNKAELDALSKKCQSKRIYEISFLWKGRFEKFVYVARCQNKLSEAKSSVSFHPNERELMSSRYRYRFNESNAMLFDAIEVPKGQTIATDSDLLIHSDIKSFPSMNFGKDDLESEIERTKIGTLANTARISFFLNILFFRINLDLKTDASFFADAAHIPMIMTLPVDATKYLNRHSGVLYTFEIPQNVRLTSLNMPDALSAHKLPIESRTDEGLIRCEGEICRYRLAVTDANNYSLNLDLTLKQSLVEKSFFPTFVEDVKIFSNTYGWPKSTSEKKRIGFYFEVSGLPKGEHPWDLWISFGQNHSGDCPQLPLKIRSVR
jgi:hypothetical protein